jgi:hypothetical protein
VSCLAAAGFRHAASRCASGPLHVTNAAPSRRRPCRRYDSARDIRMAAHQRAERCACEHGRCESQRQRQMARADNKGADQPGQASVFGLPGRGSDLTDVSVRSHRAR